MGLNSIIERLARVPVSTRAFVGFDGYVDRIQQVVQTRDATGGSYFKLISDFADRVQTLSGRSGQIEIVTQANKIGGNGPILANALGALEVETYCAGPLADPIFGEMSPEVRLLSLGPPATTNALEFGDGKVMLSEVTPFEKLNWQYVSHQVGLQALTGYFNESRLVAFVDWANLPHANDLWAGFFDHIVRDSLPDPGRYFLFDLCDPTRRTSDEINQCLEIVARYAPYGNITLGMNENEARRIFLALNGHSPSDTNRLAQTPDLDVIGSFIRKETGIPSVLIHPTDCALVATAMGVVHQQGRVVAQPRILTGAGDNLNAGYCWGLLNGFDQEDCLLMGMAASGAYVQNGHSPTRADLLAYVAQWQTELAERLPL